MPHFFKDFKIQHAVPSLLLLFGFGFFWRVCVVGFLLFFVGYSSCAQPVGFFSDLKQVAKFQPSMSKLRYPTQDRNYFITDSFFFSQHN